jgi:hypothetical protein
MFLMGSSTHHAIFTKSPGIQLKLPCNVDRRTADEEEEPAIEKITSRSNNICIVFNVHITRAKLKRRSRSRMTAADGEPAFRTTI